MKWNMKFRFCRGILDISGQELLNSKVVKDNEEQSVCCGHNTRAVTHSDHRWWWHSFIDFSHCEGYLPMACKLQPTPYLLEHSLPVSLPNVDNNDLQR